jgi:hypothetical protein
MPNSSVSVRDVFTLPEPGVQGESAERWAAFEQRVSNQVIGIKTAALHDLVSKVGELLDVPIPGIFLTSWRKTNVLQDFLTESKKTPEVVLNLELAEHTINSEHRPHIEIKIPYLPVRRIEFALRLVFKLKGFVLKIQNGAIKEMLSGNCEVRGTLEYEDLVVAEKKPEQITLPESVPLEAVRTFWKQNDYLNREDPFDRLTSAKPTDQLKAPPVKQLSAAAGAGRSNLIEAFDRLRGPEALDRPVNNNVPPASPDEKVSDKQTAEEGVDREQIVL